MSWRLLSERARLSGLGFWLLAVVALGFVLIPVLRLVHPETGATGFWNLRIYALFTGGAVMVCAAAALMADLLSGRCPRPYPRFAHETVLLVFPFVGLCSIAVGLIEGNALIYMASDAYSWLLIPAAYYICVRKLDYQSALDWLSAFYRMQIAFMLLRFGEQLIALQQPGVTESSASARYVIPLLVIGLTTRGGGLLVTAKRWHVPLIMIGLCSVLLSYSRTEWLTTIFGLGTAALVGGFSVVKRYAAAAIVVASVLLIGGLVAGTGDLSQHRIADYGRLKVNNALADADRLLTSLAGDGRAEGSFDQKVLESVDAWNYLQRNGSSLNVLVGMGSGAEWRPSLGKEKGGDTLRGKPGLRHTIHNFFGGKIFRYGVIGLGVILLFFFSLTKAAWHVVQSSNVAARGVALKVFLIVCAMVALRQLSTDAVMLHAVFGLYLGVHGVLLREEKANRRATMTGIQGVPAL